MVARVLLILCLGVALTASSGAQATDSGAPGTDTDLWQVSLQNGVVLRNVRLMALSDDDLLTFRSGDSTGVVPLAQLTELRHYSTTISPDTAPQPRRYGVNATDRLYQFVPYDLEEKRRILQQILGNQSLELRPQH